MRIQTNGIDTSETQETPVFIDPDGVPLFAGGQGNAPEDEYWSSNTFWLGVFAVTALVVCAWAVVSGGLA